MRLIFKVVLPLVVLAATGTHAWQVNINGSHHISADQAYDVAVNATGDIFAVGSLQDGAFPAQTYLVTKLSGETGEQLWQVKEAGGLGTGAHSVGIDPFGDIVTAGIVVRDGSAELHVRKVKPADGHTAWLTAMPQKDVPARHSRAWIDRRGDIVVWSGWSGATEIRKLSGATGRDIWRQEVDEIIEGIALDSEGDVLVAGAVANRFAIVKLSGVDGEELWRTVLLDGRAQAVVADFSGDIFAAGFAGNRNYVTKVRGSNGERVWEYGDPAGEARAIAVDSSGDIVLGGSGGYIVKLAGEDGRRQWSTFPCNPVIGAATLAITLDGSTSVLAAGSTFFQSRDFSVFRLNASDGMELWCSSIDGESGASDHAVAVQVDSTGYVIAAGYTENEEAESRDFTVAKFAYDTGEEQWRVTIDGAGENRSADRALAIASDDSGNIFAAGEVQNDDSPKDFSVVKVAGATGHLDWRRDLSGTASKGNDRARAIAVHPDGDAVAAGETENAGTGTDFTVLKLASSDGAERWRYLISGDANGRDLALDVSVDDMGYIVAAGQIENIATKSDIVVVKLVPSDGTELWHTVLRGGIDGSDHATSVAIDATGDVLVAGTTENPMSGRDFTVSKLARDDGKELWRAVLRGSFPQSVDESTAIAVNGEGNLVAAGFIDGRTVGGTGATDTDFLVVMLDGGSGEERWRQVITGTDENSTDVARAVSIDTAGDVIAAGSTEEDRDVNLRFAVFKLSGVTGEEIWRHAQGTSFSQALDVAVDSMGDVFASGILSSWTGTDFTIMKLAGGGGEELWRRDVTGSGAGTTSDQAYAVCVDPFGDVAAAGYTVNADSLADFTVVKLSGTDGVSLWPCPGDCDASGNVAIDELVAGIRIALGLAAVDRCLSLDGEQDGMVAIAELTLAVISALNGCP